MCKSLRSYLELLRSCLSCCRCYQLITGQWNLSTIIRAHLAPALLSDNYHLAIISSSNPVTVFTLALPFWSGIKEKQGLSTPSMGGAEGVAIKDGKMNKVASVSMTAVCIRLWNQLPHLLLYQHGCLIWQKKGGFLKSFWWGYWFKNTSDLLNKNCPSHKDLVFHSNLFSPTQTQHSNWFHCLVFHLWLKMCWEISEIRK